MQLLYKLSNRFSKGIWEWMINSKIFYTQLDVTLQAPSSRIEARTIVSNHAILYTEYVYKSDTQQEKPNKKGRTAQPI